MIKDKNMKAENKIRMMMWTIVLLAVMNIATILTVVYARNVSGKTETSQALDQAIPESSSTRNSGRYFRDQLGFSQEQMNKFVELNPGFRQQFQHINIELAMKRYRMLKEMSAASTDTNKLNQLSDSIGNMHACLKKLTYAYYLDIKKICDKDQQKKLEQIFGKIFNTDTQTRHYGKGGSHGRQHGRRINN
jgi:hypothetical protein